jgi:hypothetical protein
LALSHSSSSEQAAQICGGALSVTAAGQRNSRTVTIMKTISLERSVAMIPDGATLMIGGFMAVGTPERVFNEIVRQSKRDLTVIANDTATPGHEHR